MADDPSQWTEHTHSDGRRYFYNRATKASSWDKPEALKSSAEKANMTVWKEYKTADGRDYFFNTVTKASVWEMPPELKRLREEEKEKQQSSEEEQPSEDEKSEEPEWKTPDERRAAFRDLLTDKGVKHSMKWEEALKLVSEDRRFNALNTAGERKQVFAEWVTKSFKAAKEAEREKKKRAKDDFIDALKGWDELKLTGRYKDAAEKFMDEEWFALIEEDDRDEVFQDFLDEQEKKAKDDRRKQRKEHVETIKKVYEENEEIAITSRWRDVQDLLRDNETFRWLTKLEALTSWEEWVTDSGKTLLEKKAKDKSRGERTVRDNFRDLLEKAGNDGKISSGTQWRDFCEKVCDDERYVKMVSQSGSTPHDLFDDYIEGLADKVNQDRGKVKKVAKKKGLVVNSSSTYEWFHDQLKDEANYAKIPEDTRRSVFDALSAKAKEQDAEAEKNAKKNRKKFVELLQKTREVTAKTTYVDAQRLLGTAASWDAVDEHTRKQCFDIFVDQLKKMAAAAGEDESDDEKQTKPKSKKKKEEPPPEPPKKSKKRKEEEPEEPPKKSKKTKK